MTPVEMSDHGPAWFTSSYSDGAGNNCVEVASLPAQVGVRDSKKAQGPALTVPIAAWHTFISFAAAPV